MSGKPHPDGVKDLSQWLRKLDEAEARTARLTTEIQHRQTQLDESQKNTRTAKEQVKKLMSQMDIESPGNIGYEGRLLWTLRELTRQAEEIAGIKEVANAPADKR